MTTEHLGPPGIDTLAMAEDLIAAKMPIEKAKAVARALGDISREPIGVDPAWMMFRLTSAGLTPEQALVMTRWHEAVGAERQKGDQEPEP